MFCILLVLSAVVSYRSIPRILTLTQTYTPLNIKWIPHFTSVINWTLRLGVGLLNTTKPIASSWIAIIDHSIDIGTKKVLVVLRVLTDTLAQRGQAITLEDCECVGLTVSEKVNGESIAIELEQIFEKAGKPCAILKDKDATLNKGVRLYLEQQSQPIQIIDDLGHVNANALKAEFEESKSYHTFKDLIRKGRARLRQTDLAFLIPPKLRRKGRFQSISKLGQWGSNILEHFSVKGRAAKGSVLDRFRQAFPGFGRLRPFIERFAHTSVITSGVMKLLKTHGLNQKTYAESKTLIEQLPERSVVRKRLSTWLSEHLKIQKILGCKTLLVSSDIIESLFGHFKHVLERSPQADMNRSVLLIPTLCGQLNETIIAQVFEETPHAEIKRWEDQHIPYTVRKKRQAFFAENKSQKPVKTLIE